MARVALLGGAGFIGSALAELLDRKGDELLVVDRLDMSNGLTLRGLDSQISLERMDLKETDRLSALLCDFEPDTVFHLAANSDIRQSSVDSRIDLRETFQTTASIALALTKLPPKRVSFVFSSSSAVFGKQEGPIDGDSVPEPGSSYGWMKLASEALIEMAVNFGAVSSAAILRFPNVTGRGQTHGVVRDLVAKYLDLSVPWQVLGDGHQTKPYIHVSELVEVMSSVVTNCEPGGCLSLNLSPSDRASVAEITSWIDAFGGLNRTPVFEATPYGWKGDVPEYSYDLKQQSALGYSFSSSEQALKASIEEEFRLYVS